MMLSRDRPIERAQAHNVPPVTEGSFRDLSTLLVGSAGSPTRLTLRQYIGSQINGDNQGKGTTALPPQGRCVHKKEQ